VFRWHSQPLGPRVDLGDKEAMRALPDRDEGADEADDNRP
jgi:hypothetical protein